MRKGLKVIGGSSAPVLTDDICQILKREHYLSPETEVKLQTFSDGESWVQIEENVRGYDVFVVQSLSNPANENLMELMFILDALKRSNVNSVTVVIPYYGYARQDRKSEPRVPISAKVVADMLQTMKIDRIVTIDLHAGQIQGFFDVPFDNLYASKIMAGDMADENGNLCIVSPDRGGTERANYYSKKLESSLAVCYKHRDKPNEISEMGILGDVTNKKCVIVDDIIDTAGTICKASELLREQGARDVVVYSTHPVLSGNAVEKLDNAPISKIVVTDTISPSEEVLRNQKFEVLSVAPLLSEAILSIYFQNSVSNLFI